MQILDDLKAKLLEANDIFAGKGYYFKNNIDFVASGVSDRFVNLFYIRHTKTGPQKYRVQARDFPSMEVTSNCRLVAQISKKIDQEIALTVIYNQISTMEGVTIRTYSDDTLGIYADEYGKPMDSDSFHLISIDFDATTTDVIGFNRWCGIPSDCDCLTENMCI